MEQLRAGDTQPGSARIHSTASRSASGASRASELSSSRKVPWPRPPQDSPASESGVLRVRSGEIHYKKMEQNVGFRSRVNLARRCHGDFSAAAQFRMRGWLRMRFRLAVEWMLSDPGCGARRLNCSWDGSKQNSIANFPSLGTNF